MPTQVKVFEKQSQSTLFSCPIDQIDRAYQEAAKYEALGLDVEVLAPGVATTLAASLGANEVELEGLKQGFDEEIAGHEEELGCATCIK